MNSWKTTTCVVALFFGGLAVPAPAQVENNHQAEVLLQEAKHRALVDGDLERSIELCQQILTEHPGNRAMAAQALLQMGGCYEKLGKQEAQKAYQRLIKEFADQNDVASQARVRLAALERDNGKSGVTVRQVWEPSRKPMSDSSGAPSPDGRYLSFTNWSEGNLAVRDLTTGEYRDLTNEGTWDGNSQRAGGSIWSPDGKQIAYAWSNAGHWELRIVGLDGSGPRVLYHNKELKVQHPNAIWPVTWSQDGKDILARFCKKRGPDGWVWEIVLISVADGSVRVLRSLESLSRWHHMSLSPDGHGVVYDCPAKEREGVNDIFLLATDGSGEEVPLVQHPAYDWGPVWAPDGRSIFFVSDRSGANAAWLMQVADGKPVGEPRLIKEDAGEMSPMGFTREGSLYYHVGYNSTDVYTVSIDPDTGKLLAPPVKAIRSFEGLNSSPAWSPDGKGLAYVSERPSPGSAQRRDVLVIRSEETGQERELHPKKVWPQNLRWSPDGRSILCGNSLQLIDVKTGDVSSIVKFPPKFAPTDNVKIGAWALSPDWKTVFYARQMNGSHSIITHDLASGKEKELCQEEVHWAGLGISPDGRQLVFAKDGNTLMVIAIEGGELRILHRLQEGRGFAFRCPPRWTVDGRYVLFGKRHPVELWRVPGEGGEAQKVLAMDGLQDVSVHPDGRRIAFTCKKWIDQVWAMENFLPESTSDKDE